FFRNIGSELLMEFILLDVEILAAIFDLDRRRQCCSKRAAGELNRETCQIFTLFRGESGDKYKRLHIVGLRSSLTDNCAAIGMANQNNRRLETGKGVLDIVRICQEAAQRIGDGDNRVAVLFKAGDNSVPA